MGSNMYDALDGHAIVVATGYPCATRLRRAGPQFYNLLSLLGSIDRTGSIGLLSWCLRRWSVWGICVLSWNGRPPGTRVVGLVTTMMTMTMLGIAGPHHPHPTSYTSFVFVQCIIAITVRLSVCPVLYDV